MKKHLISLLLLFAILIPFAAHAEDIVMVLQAPVAAGGGYNFVTDANSIAAYCMNVNGDDESDQTGNGETMVEGGGDIPTSADVPNGYTQGVSRLFAAADTEYFQCLDGGELDIGGENQSITIAFWVKFTSDTGLDQAIINKYDYAADQRQYQVRYDDSDAAINFILSPDGETTTGSIAIGSIDVASGGAWHHVACVYNDTDMRIYIDGSLDDEGNVPLAYTNGIFPTCTAHTYIGDRNGNDLHLDGQLYQLIVLDRALSAQEVTTLYTYGIYGDNGVTCAP